MCQSLLVSIFVFSLKLSHVDTKKYSDIFSFRNKPTIAIMSDIENNTGLDVMMESDNEENNDKHIDDLPTEENQAKSDAEAAEVNDDEDDAEPAGLDLGEVLAEVAPVPSGSWIKIANLMRPFTPVGLKKKITELGGDIADPKTDFWLNNIKSVAFVKLSNHAEVHAKILEGMNGQTWPESSIKQLELTVVDQVEKDNAVTVDQGGHVTPPKHEKPVVVDARAALDKRATDQSEFEKYFFERTYEKCESEHNF